MGKILKIKKVNVLKFASIMALIYGILSLAFILIFALWNVFIMGNFAAIIFLLIGPVMYAIVGFIGGALTGWVYNMVAKRIGGVEVEVEELEKFSE